MRNIRETNIKINNKRMKYRLALYLIIITVLLFPVKSCVDHVNFRMHYTDVNKLIHENENVLQKPYLKAHTRNGNVAIFDESWKVDTVQNVVKGKGSIFDFGRTKLSEGNIKVSIDSVLIFETNKILDDKGERGRVAALTVLTAVDVILGAICVTQPKVCWGSCPTFYLDDTNHVFGSDAEGFSESFTPSLEATDIDALNNPRLKDSTVTLYMKNEALETHVVKQLSLLAAPRKADERVFQTANDHFYACQRELIIPYSANGPEGNIIDIISNRDGKERLSPADMDNLGSKEEVHLEFGIVPGKEYALVVNYRQSLLTTYLFYNILGYMGDNISDFITMIEKSDDPYAEFAGVFEMLGGIDIFSWNDHHGRWDLQGTLNEAGPIAMNTQLVPFIENPGQDTLKIKLHLNKGLWRVDAINLAEIKQEVFPQKISPVTAQFAGRPFKNEAWKLTDPSGYIITYPGEQYELSFRLPEEIDDCELFLSSTGYYLEWMRKAWLDDKNLLKLRQIVYHPEQYLRSEAGFYKAYESEMERIFKNSKIRHNEFAFKKY